VYTADEGTVTYQGDAVAFTHPRQAMDAGLVTVFQEFNLLPERTVAQNVFLGREPRRAGFIDHAGMIRRTRDLLDDLGVGFLDPAARVGSLTVAEQQIVEIVKALSFDARVISMDEPTAALSDHEVELLYAIVGRLTARGVAVIYVSHRLKEIFDLCDRITILKDGVLVSTDAAADLSPDELVRRMVGRPIQSYFPGPVEGTRAGDVLLQLEGCGNEYVDGVDLTLRAGEIVGVAGLQGSGRTELLEGVFGIQPFQRGTMSIAGGAGRAGGAARRIAHPRQAVRAGLALVTEDRKAQGLALGQSVLDNALLVIRSVFAGRAGTARRDVPGILSSLEVTSRGAVKEVRFLSGGNQQKVVLAKWLVTDPRIVLFDEPTRGIDVGAKVAVYQLMRQLAAEGKAVLMVSSELPEVIGMSDRILVMRDGALVAELPAGSAEHDVLAAATGTTARPGDVVEDPRVADADPPAGDGQTREEDAR
ncbi:MAG: sugar ABC transporter ATP-binding protein, partial [Microbacterium sp.]